MKQNLLLLFLIFFTCQAQSQLNDECFEMEPICTSVGLTFTAAIANDDAMDTQPSNNYSCYFSAPNPTWYYFDIAASGPIHMSLFANSDIDFIIWGPYADLTAAQAQCGNLGTGGSGGAVIDCSYSATNSEYPTIPNAVAGEIYVMLITNYANVVQDLTLTQIGGTGATDCGAVDPNPCIASVGTYTMTKNNIPTTGPIYLCPGDSFELNSNNDYVLPMDTVPNPVGDGIYSAQLMWLVYESAPVSSDPIFDPGFLNYIIPDDSISDINDLTGDIIDDFGCGTYWFVPVTGDDGVGANNNVANGSTDNGGLHWDKNGNDCYILGTPVQITFACDLGTTVTLHCDAPFNVNGIDVQISGGSGNYNVINQGAGNLQSTAVANGGTAHINNLENNQIWEIDLVDEAGCSANVSGNFVTPVINSVSLSPALSCPLVGNGTVNVLVNGTSGNGGPYTITMASDPPTTGISDSYSNVAGTLVHIIVADDEGCITDSSVTIPSSGHFIDVQTTSVQDELCYGDGNGAATISAVPTPSGSVVNITWTGPSGQHPGGNPGGPANNSQSNLEPGFWYVTVTDDTGCEVSHAITIGSPQQLQLYTTSVLAPTCFGSTDGSISLQATGGQSPFTFTPSMNLTNIPAGNYTTYVTDANGCMDSLVITLTQPDSISTDFIVKNIICWGDSTGAIIADEVYNTVGTKSYLWDLNGTLPDPPSSSNLANGLPIGTYALTIQDAVCSKDYEFVLIENPELEFLSLGSNPVSVGFDGSVYCDVTGGGSGYTYTWTNLNDMSTSNDPTWSGLNPGNYAIEIIDTNGCTLTDTISIGWLGNEEFTANNPFTVFPTLIRNGQLNIINSYLTQAVMFKIYDATGKVIFESPVDAAQTNLQLTLASGTYSYAMVSSENKPLQDGKIIVIAE
jgi:hypothetical protein